MRLCRDNRRFVDAWNSFQSSHGLSIPSSMVSHIWYRCHPIPRYDHTGCRDTDFVRGIERLLDTSVAIRPKSGPGHVGGIDNDHSYVLSVNCCFLNSYIEQKILSQITLESFGQFKKDGPLWCAMAKFESVGLDVWIGSESTRAEFKYSQVGLISRLSARVPY